MDILGCIAVAVISYIATSALIFKLRVWAERERINR